MNNTTMMLTTAMLFALLITAVLGLSEAAEAQGSSPEVKRPESPFACNRLALTPEQRDRHFDELGPTLRSLKKGARELRIQSPCKPDAARASCLPKSL
jgi:hypothetical protein